MEKESRVNKVTDQVGASLLRFLLGGLGFLFVGTALTGAFYSIYRICGGERSCGDAFKEYGPTVCSLMGIFSLFSHFE